MRTEPVVWPPQFKDFFPCYPFLYCVVLFPFVELSTACKIGLKASVFHFLVYFVTVNPPLPAGGVVYEIYAVLAFTHSLNRGNKTMCLILFFMAS